VSGDGDDELGAICAILGMLTSGQLPVDCSQYSSYKLCNMLVYIHTTTYALCPSYCVSFGVLQITAVSSLSVVCVCMCVWGGACVCVCVCGGGGGHFY
jgi:hypothetical protein